MRNFKFESMVNESIEPIYIYCNGAVKYPGGIKMMIGDRDIDLSRVSRMVITIEVGCLPCVEAVFS